MNSRLQQENKNQNQNHNHNQKEEQEQEQEREQEPKAKANDNQKQHFKCIMETPVTIMHKRAKRTKKKHKDEEGIVGKGEGRATENYSKLHATRRRKLRYKLQKQETVWAYIEVEGEQEIQEEEEGVEVEVEVVNDADLGEEDELVLVAFNHYHHRKHHHHHHHRRSQQQQQHQEEDHRHLYRHHQPLSSGDDNDEDEAGDEDVYNDSNNEGGYKMTFVNKLSKSFRWLRCSTLCAILFYMFFIGLILHSTSHKLQQQQQQQQQHQQNQQEHADQTKLGPNVEPQHSKPEELEQQPKLNSLLTTNDLDSEKAKLEAKANEKEKEKEKENHYRLHHQLQQKVHPKAGISLELAKNASKSPETVILAASNVNEKQILAKAFKRADRNRDGRLSIQELGQYINRRIVDHIDEAIMNNAREFRRVDIGPADGLITWDEYHRFFLHDHGMSDADIDEHDEIKHTALNRKAREDMMRDKARWSEAARTDLFTLTIDEYLSFKHPESSVSNLLELVDDLLRQFDQDGDEQLTIEEFTELNVDDDDDFLRKSLISKTLVERREEFKRIIDKNHDGKADRGELLNYVNPKTPRYALQEAATLFSLCDENKDEKLTLKEMTDNAEIFLQSKMIDTANSFHTEF